MSQDQEWLVRLQFLEEAQEYLNTIESELLGLSTQGISSEGYNSILRAAHSIKGGSALMGFMEMSELAHRLEDFFKVLKGGHRSEVVDASLEQLFLQALDDMGQMPAFYRQRQPITPEWLAAHPHPLLDQLHARLGDPQAEDEIADLSSDAGEDMVSLMFSSEVEPCLDRIAGIMADPAMPLLKEEFVLACQEMDGLGEMLELPVFSGLCQQVLAALEPVEGEELVAIARVALEELQRVQAMVVLGQVDLLPPQLDLSPISQDPSPDASPEPSSNIPLENQPSGLISESSPKVEESPPPVPNFDTPPRLEDLPSLEDLSNLVDSSKFEEVDPTKLMEAHLMGNLQDTTVQDNTAQDNKAQNSARDNTAPKDTNPATNNAAASPKSDLQDFTIRVSVGQLDHLGELLGELTTERGGLGLRLSSLKSLMGLLNNRVKSLNEANGKLRQAYDSNAIARSQPHSSSQGSRAPFQSPSRSQTSNEDPATIDLNQQFDNLEMDQYSELHLIAQEIIERVVQIQEVSGDIELALNETDGLSRELNRTARQMQVSMAQVRMRPISELTRRFPRLLRQLSLQHNKSVQLREQGTGTLIERSVLEALQDPLTHLLRNCFDHGIESPEVRQQQGKPAQGTIEISASHRGNQTVITIRDDGRGIDIDKIKAKAVSNMGLTREEVNAVNPQEILDLIFEPGFSTAESVTDLSGRGVGMDVVRRNLEAIEGSVSVATEPGQGTTFTLTVPLSLSVTRVLVVESHGMFLAFPTGLVEEMLLLNREQVMTAANQELLEWQGYTVPLLRLNQWIGFNRPPVRLDTDSAPIIDEEGALLVTHNQEPYAIHCDRYWGEQEVTTRLVEGKISLPTGFSSCVVLGDGRVVPLVEPESLLNWIFAQQKLLAEQQAQGIVADTNISARVGEAAQVSSNESRETTLTLTHNSQSFVEKPTIMIVDDSINVRRFLAITLEKAGYRVEQAKDGLDALEKLKEDIAMSAIISDVEMPRMDGFRFLASIRTINARKDIPVVMLTSRSGDKHRRLAKQLGAADYFSKPFKQNELLGRLAELTQTEESLGGDRLQLWETTLSPAPS